MTKQRERLICRATLPATCPARALAATTNARRNTTSQGRCTPSSPLRARSRDHDERATEHTTRRRYRVAAAPPSFRFVSVTHLCSPRSSHSAAEPGIGPIMQRMSMSCVGAASYAADGIKTSRQNATAAASAARERGRSRARFRARATQAAGSCGRARSRAVARGRAARGTTQ